MPQVQMMRKCFSLSLMLTMKTLVVVRIGLYNKF